YAVALAVAEALQDRRPEVETLRAIGYVCMALGQYAEAARNLQRSLALAEAELDQGGAPGACEGLAEAALAQGQWSGAHAWYSRGLRLAEAADDAVRAGRLQCQLGVVARHQGDLSAAGEFLREARERLESAGVADEMARVLNEQGRLDAQLGRHDAASAATRAHVFFEYGLFRNRLGQRDEARAYLEQARELFASLGETAERERADAELRALTA